MLRLLNNRYDMPRIVFARLGAKRANTRLYLTDEQRSIVKNSPADNAGYLVNDALTQSSHESRPSRKVCWDKGRIFMAIHR